MKALTAHYDIADTILNTCTSLHYNFNLYIFYTPLFSLNLNEYLILLNLS